MLTFEQFLDCIETIQDQMDDDAALNDLLSDKFALESTMLCNPLTTKYIELLRNIFNDESDWISYYIYDLDFGKEYREGVVQDENGQNVPLLTVEDLYNLLIENMENKDVNKEED